MQSIRKLKLLETSQNFQPLIHLNHLIEIFTKTGIYFRKEKEMCSQLDSTILRLLDMSNQMFTKILRALRIFPKTFRIHIALIQITMSLWKSDKLLRRIDLWMFKTNKILSLETMYNKLGHLTITQSRLLLETNGLIQDNPKTSVDLKKIDLLILKSNITLTYLQIEKTLMYSKRLKIWSKKLMIKSRGGNSTTMILKEKFKQTKTWISVDLARIKDIPHKWGKGQILEGSQTKKTFMINTKEDDFKTELLTIILENLSLQSSIIEDQRMRGQILEKGTLEMSMMSLQR